MLFVDRADAGRHLSHRLRRLRGADVIVLGLPRGGVAVAFEVAEDLHAPLDVIVVRKLGVPFQPEYGFGAIGEDGVSTIDDYVVRQTGLTGPQIAEVEARERVVLDHRVSHLRGDHPPVQLAGRTVIIVDDGIATGSTARAACLVARARGARRVILAVPVGSVEGIAALRRDADEVVCLHTPERFLAIGDWYDNFSQVTDEEVTVLLGQAAAFPAAATATASWRCETKEQRMPPGQEPVDHRIVVGIDGSLSSREALRWAVRQAALTGAVVDAIIAWHDPSSYGGYGWLIADTSYAELATKTLAEAVDSTITPESGVTVRQRVVAGNPARVLLDAADGADLLVVGSRGHGGFAGMLLGSVSQHCAHHSPCPVVVIRGQRNT